MPGVGGATAEGPAVAPPSLPELPDLPDLNLDGNSDGEKPNAEPTPGGDGDGGSDGDGDGDPIIRIGDELGDGISIVPDGDGERFRVVDGDGSGQGEPYDGCVVFLTREPTPGATVPVLVWNEREPVPDVPVWFGDELQGRTDETGRVVGEVGYEEELEVRVSVPSADSCIFATENGAVSGENVDDSRVNVDGSRSNVDASGIEDTSLSTAVTGGTPVGGVGDTRQANVRYPVAPDSGEHSGTVPVSGNLTVGVQGEPYPGETVRVVATIDGRPVPDATVGKDGDRVGETNRSGELGLTLPEDGTETVTVTVTRGDFTGTQRVDLYLLTVQLQPERPLPVPGQRAVASVTMGGEPVANTTVDVGGESVGTTDENGTVTFTLPSDTDVAASAAVRGQTDAAPVWQLYLPTVLSTVVLVVVGVLAVVLARRREGRPSQRTVVVGWIGAFALYVAYVLGGKSATALTALGLLAVGVLVGLVLRREEATRRAAETGDWLQRVLERVKRGAVWAADRLLAAALALGGYVRALLARVRDVPLSVSGLRRTVRSLAASVAATLSSTLEVLTAQMLRGVRFVRKPRILAVLMVTVLAVGTTYVLVGPRVALLVLVVVLVAAAILSRREKSVEDRSSSADAPTVGASSSVDGSAEGHDHSPLTLRRLWRTFARWVVPGRWQSRTPGEVSRAAIDRGFPAEPVRELTRVFRDVEYGNQSLSSQRWTVAKTAYEALAKARETQSEEEDT